MNVKSLVDLEGATKVDERETKDSDEEVEVNGEIESVTIQNHLVFCHKNKEWIVCFRMT